MINFVLSLLLITALIFTISNLYKIYKSIGIKEIFTKNYLKLILIVIYIFLLTKIIL